MYKIFNTAMKLLVLMTIITGLAYPLTMTLLAQTIFPEQAKGSFIYVNNQIAGSKLIGQNFTEEKYFHSRPSANNYDALASGGSNLSYSNPILLKNICKEISKVRVQNNLDNTQSIPSDLATTSASGLDPHISLPAAEIQIERIARTRGLQITQVQSLIKENTQNPILGFIGEPCVNVLTLNIALDKHL